MLKPVIMIGCGGSGQKTVRYIRDVVRRNLRHADWNSMPKAWRFIALDTLTVQEAPNEIPTLPASDYISVSLNYKTYPELQDALLRNYPPTSEQYSELIGWRPSRHDVNVPLAEGAGQMRAVGRIAGLKGLMSMVRPKLEHAFGQCMTGGPELESVSHRLGVPVPAGGETPDPIVAVVGSMAGGTGAGIMLDVIDLIRRTDPRGQFPILIVFTPDIFGVKDNRGMSANGTAFMSELMAAYWGEQDSKLIPSLTQATNHGPHSVFMIGRKNTRGLDLFDSTNVYRATGEALASWVMSENVQQEVNNFITVNWSSDCAVTSGGYPFAAGAQRGAISSFGAAKLSLGREKFLDYAAKLILRDLIIHLDKGHERAARDELGEDIDRHSAQFKIQKLVEGNIVQFQSACQLYENDDETKQITDRFASKNMAETEQRTVYREIEGILDHNRSQAGSNWKTQIESQRVAVTSRSKSRSHNEFNQLIQNFGSETLQSTLVAVSDYLGRYGMKVTAHLVQDTQTDIKELAKNLKGIVNREINRAKQAREKASEELAAIGSDKVGLKHDRVSKAIKHTANSITLEWRSTRFKQVADALEALGREMLKPIAESLNQQASLINSMANRVNSKSPIIETWPQRGGGVPKVFQPSPLEFFIEDPQKWESQLSDLLSEVMEITSISGYRPNNPLDTIRYLILSGYKGFGEAAWAQPIMWAKSYGADEPQWLRGNKVLIELQLDTQHLEDRIMNWLRRPDSKAQRVFSEGLRNYLLPEDPISKEPIPDHEERLELFRQRLGEAKNQSQPLIDLNDSLANLLYDSTIDLRQTKLLTEGFPFPDGHPARDLVTEVIGNDLDIDFVDHDTESVMLSSFMPAPVHPMVISSFTRPLASVIDAIGTNFHHMHGSFWLWRRARTLKDFIPVPDEVLKALIRGFAVARMVGCITVDPTSPVRIVPLLRNNRVGHSRRSEPCEFPFPLLTPIGRENILAGLLEGFSLCFGRVPTKGTNAFEPYTELYEYGAKEGAVYRLPKAIDLYLDTGTLPKPMEPLDQPWFHAIAGDDQGCSDKLVRYLERNLDRFEELMARDFTGAEYRSRQGILVPDDDILTIELIEEMIASYKEVLDSLVNRAEGSVI